MSVARWSVSAALAVPTVLFGISVASCVWIELTIAGGMAHMRLPELLLVAHAAGLALFIGLLVWARNLERVRLEQVVAVIIICVVGTWGAFRNGPFWQYAESIECAWIGVCR